MIVVALKPHSPDGSKSYQTDEEYEIDPPSAETLIAFGLVRRRDLNAEDSKPEEVSNGRYSRRDVRRKSN